MIEYNVKHHYKTLPIKEFYERFYNYELVQGYCRECSRYNTNYSCSPVDINIKEHILGYDYIDIIVTQLFFKKEDYSKDYTKEELNTILKNTFMKEKEKIVKKVLDDEKKYSKANALTGPCNYCDVECKKIYSQCIHPDKMRYSLASLAMDSNKILKELFNIELLLIEGKLPKYLNNVTSILYTK